jgi:multidrug efflux pump subunit AcrA (membrane-fusion protein)
LVIPRAALIGSVQDAKIFVVNNSIAKLRSIVTGKEVGTSLEVLQGLQEGESVVVDGANNLSDNTQVIVH